MAVATQARRKAVVDTWVDEALAAEDEAEAARVEREAAEAAAEARRADLTAERARLVEDRLKAIAVAEEKAADLIEAFVTVLACAGAERRCRGELGERHGTVHRDSVERRLSGYLAHELRRLTGSRAPRFGLLGLPALFPMAGRTWAEDETFRTGERPVETPDMEKEDDGEDHGAAVPT